MFTLAQIMGSFVRQWPEARGSRWEDIVPFNASIPQGAGPSPNISV